MPRYLADENFNAAILRGILRQLPAFDVITVQEVGLTGAEDPIVLDWAANNGRMLLTHDVSTIPTFVRRRVEMGQPMPGVVEVSALASIGRVIEDMLLLDQCSLENEWENQIVHIPF